jgi:outer membrane protein
MKKMFAVVGLMFVLIAARSLSAQEMKIGLVDFQRALNEVEEGKAAKARLKGEFDEKQKTLDALQNELKAMKDNLEKQKLVLSQDALKQKETEYRDKFIELQKKLADFRGELQQKEAQYTSDIIVALRQIVQEVGAKDKYTLIFERGQDVVLYAPTAADLTPQVITLYNSRPKGKK